MNTSQRGILRSVMSPPWSSRPKGAESRPSSAEGYSTRDPGSPLRAVRDDVDHAASACGSRRRRFSANTIAASRTQAPLSCAFWRASALAVARPVAGDHFLELGPVDLAEGPVPGGFVEAQPRSGNVKPRWRPCGTVASTNFWRSSSFEKRLIFQRIERSECQLAVGGPEHHQRRPPPAVQRVLRHGLAAAVPRESVSMIS